MGGIARDTTFNRRGRHTDLSLRLQGPQALLVRPSAKGRLSVAKTFGSGEGKVESVA